MCETEADTYIFQKNLSVTCQIYFSRANEMNTSSRDVSLIV